MKRGKYVIQGDFKEKKGLMKKIKELITCPKLIALIKKFLKGGYLESNKGSELSALLCNIYLHQLDNFMEDLKSNRGVKGASTQEESIQYIRYKEDFLVGIQGPYSLAVQIKQEIAEFLKTMDPQWGSHKLKIIK